MHDATCKDCGARLTWARNHKRHWIPMTHSVAVDAAVQQYPTATVEWLREQFGDAAQRHRCGT